MEKTITVTIQPDGQTSIEASGFTGGSCVKATQPLKETLIGEAPAAQVLKPEYHIPQPPIAERMRQ